MLQNNLFVFVVIIGFFGFCLAFFNIIGFIRLYDRKKKERTETEELKKEQMGKVTIIGLKMDEVFKNDPHFEDLFKHYFFPEGNSLKTKSWYLPNILYKIFFEESSKLFFESKKQSFQKFFDQLLRIYARKLKSAYDEGNELRERYKSISYDSLSGEEIRILIRVSRAKEMEKELAQIDFWSLHDAIRYIGFDVFSNKEDGFGHKAYLYLRGSLLF